MAKKRRPNAGRPRRPSPYAGSVRQNPVRRPPRQRRSSLSRMSTRGATLIVLGTAVAAIAGVAIAGAITTGGGTSPSAVNTPAPVTTSSSPSQAPGPLAPTPSVSQSSAAPKPSPHRSVSPSASPTPAAKSATPSASAAGCPPATQRVEQARTMLQHQSALPNVRLITAGPRSGLLGAADPNARTLTLYVRSCAAEPTTEIAVVWAYEAGQFIQTEKWDSSTVSRWTHDRGISGTPSSTALKQDAASVYAFWQTGTARYWQSPYSPPPYGQLSSLSTFLQTS